MDRRIPAGLSRRRALLAAGSAVGLTATAGCSLYDQTGATDVIVSNAAAESLAVSVTIVNTGADATHTSRTLTLAPGETVDPVNDSKLPTNTGYAVTVAVEGGPEETFEWADPTLELAPLWVRVDGSDNITFLLQAG